MGNLSVYVCEDILFWELFLWGSKDFPSSKENGYRIC